MLPINKPVDEKPSFLVGLIIHYQRRHLRFYKSV